MAELGPDVLYVIEEQDPLSGDWQLSEDSEYTLSAAACADEAARWVPEAYAGVEALAPGYRTRVVEYRRVGVVAGPYGEPGRAGSRRSEKKHPWVAFGLHVHPKGCIYGSWRLTP